MFDMRTSTTGSVERNKKICDETAIIQELVDEQGIDGGFRHDGNADLVRHVNNTRCRWGKFGMTPGKANRDSPMLVDLCVAMIGANVGRRDALNSGKVKLTGKKRSGNGPRMMIMK